MASFYGTLTAALTFHADRGNAAWAASTDPIRTAALIRASAYIDGVYLGSFQGMKTGGRAQVLQWPRAAVMDASGWPVDSTLVPIEVENATYEGALRELAVPGSLNPDIRAGGGVTKRVKAGSVEVEFSSNTLTITTFRRIEDILAPLIGRISAYSAPASRA